MILLKIFCFVLINFVLLFAICPIKYPQKDILYLYSACVVKSPEDDRNPTGICTKLNECFDIDYKIRNSNYNHTVCGYEGTEQIVCCPWQTISNTEILRQAQREIGFTQINLDADFKCKIKSTGENGVLKFFDDCPELQGNINDGEQDFCNDELCKNLVCCPLRSIRYNPVCSNVDRIDSEINFRLNMNMPCKVKGLNNVTGTYQQTCDAYNRNEISSENVLVMCEYGYCIQSYCCPVLNANDTKKCTRRGRQQFSRIDFIGPKCIDSLTKLPGRCRHFNSCPAVTIFGRKDLDECGKDCCTDFYCCPEEDYKFESISKQKCFGYQSSVYRKQATIEILYEMDSPNTICSPVHYPHAGSIRAEPGALPHMAALGYISKDDDQIQWNCGGSLISEKFILTAAHCLQPNQFGQVALIRLGSLYLENVTKSDECAEDFGIKRVIPHPSYNRSFVYNDIGLIELDREVKFNFHMRPICLPTSPEVPDNLIGMGWGLLGPEGEKSETLYYGYLETYTYDECNKSYAFNLNRRVLTGIDDNTQLCVGSRQTITSACTGDSGGPILSILSEYDRLSEIHGITSFGTVCGFADSPGVYTKVFPYLEWIVSFVWP